MCNRGQGCIFVFFFCLELQVYCQFVQQIVDGGDQQDVYQIKYQIVVCYLCDGDFVCFEDDGIGWCVDWQYEGVGCGQCCWDQQCYCICVDVQGYIVKDGDEGCGGCCV